MGHAAMGTDAVDEHGMAHGNLRFHGRDGELSSIGHDQQFGHTGFGLLAMNPAQPYPGLFLGVIIDFQWPGVGMSFQTQFPSIGGPVES
jgi:hypothetical protein